MQEINLTNNQNKVVDARDKNILVSAGAGAGKTAVLVERIIRMITDENNPIDIDKFLIVTFTRAAAAQMKEKIRKKLLFMLGKNSNDANLRRQMSLIHTAHISTIDSFANQIVSEHFEDLDIDPNYRVVETEEEQMLLEDAIMRVLDDLYEREDEDFLKAMEQFAEGSASANIIEDIKAIIDKADNQVFPREWLESGKGKNHYNSVADFEKTELIQSQFEIFEQYKEFEQLLEDGWDATKQAHDGGFKEAIAYDIEILEKLQSANTYDKYRNIIIKYQAKTFKGDSTSFPGRDEAKDAHNQMKKYCSNCRNIFGYLPSLEEAMDNVNHAQELADILIDIAIKAIDENLREKKYINAYSFSDIEHFAIKVLCKPTEDQSLKPTDTAKEMAKEFHEILIDEYQDSNYIQEYMLSSLTGGRGIENMFMVGDVKQSIYRFRSAEPKLFIEKYDAFKENGKENEKIVLEKNFRSRPEVIDATNYIFEEIMKKDVGGIDYADGAQLKIGAGNYDINLNSGFNDNKTELICVSNNGELNRHEAEAHLIAKKILMLVDENTGLKISDKSEEARPVEYKDIVILTKAPATVVDTYISVFEEYNIPVFGEKKKGFYAAMEVNAILDVMRVADNPIQDIPLTSVMRNEVFDFTDDELAQIKKDYKKNKMYTALKGYSENGDNAKLKTKVTDFLNTLEDYREKAKYMSVYDFIEYFLETTHYDQYIRALEAGERKRMNIDMLKEIAYSYEETSYRGLFNFMRFIDKNIENDKDTGEAIEVSEEDNVVKIVSIHKSKGLEYPIVILANANFGRNTSKKDGFIDSNCNIATKSYDTKNKTKTTTAIAEMIKYDEKLEQRAEELRLLYVAMTRAKEKLILVSSFKAGKEDIAFKDTDLEKFKYDSNKSHKDRIIESSNFHGYIAPVIGKEIFDSLPEVIHRDDQIEPKDLENIRVTFVPDLDKFGEIPTVKEDDSKVDKDIDPEMVQTIKDNFDNEYKYREELGLRAKMSVTEIKKKLNKEFEDEDSHDFIHKKTEKTIPNFMREDKEIELTGAEKGNIYHKVFELLDYSINVENESEVESFLDKLVKENRLTKKEREAVEIKQVISFTSSDIAKRMKAAFDRNKLYRERKFLMTLEGSIIKDIQGIETDKSMVVQGIIDACFEEEGKYVIVDYKTDNVDDIKILEKRYKSQLDIYEIAIKKITGIEVSEKIIYSVKLGEEVKV